MFDNKSISYNYTIKDLLCDDKVINSNKFKCHECKELIYKKELYQCKMGDCIKCKSCWEWVIWNSNSNSNSNCNVKEFDDLSRCKAIEESFEKKKIYCPNLLKCDSNEKDYENGCNDIIMVKDLNSHLETCKYGFIKCNNKSNISGNDDCCEYLFRANQESKHRNQCGYELLTCSLCTFQMIRSTYETHHLTCPCLVLDCRQCSAKLKRKEFQDHISIDCPNTTISCEYSECGAKVKRYELSSHLGQHKILSENEALKLQLKEKEKKASLLERKLEESNLSLEYLEGQIRAAKNIIKGLREELKANKQLEKGDQPTPMGFNSILC